MPEKPKVLKKKPCRNGKGILAFLAATEALAQELPTELEISLLEETMNSEETDLQPVGNWDPL